MIESSHISDQTVAHDFDNEVRNNVDVELRDIANVEENVDEEIQITI